MKTVDCPNCGGSGRAGMIPMRDGHWEKGSCAICTGSGQVADWDYERLAKMVAGNKNCVQMEMPL